MEDITLSRMTQDQLVEELKYHRSHQLILNSIDRIAGIGYYEWCPEGNRLLSCSDEYAQIYNMTSAEIIVAEANWEGALQLIHPDDREKYRELVENISKSRSLELEYRIIRSDGEVRNVREIAMVENDYNSSSIRAYGILQDITGLREQSEALEYREILAQQVESITDIGHFIFDEQLGVYKYVSPGFGRIFGSTPEQYQAKVLSFADDLADIFEEDVGHVEKVYRQYDLSGEAYSVDYRIYRADGEIRWVREQCVSHSTKNGEIIESLGVLQDITEQKNIESELLSARTTLEEKVDRRTLELAETVRQLEMTRDSLEEMVEKRTRELAATVSQLQEEIAGKEKIEAELKFLANHDALTGLPSLRLGMDRLERSIVEAKRNSTPVFVMFIDLDGFKQINDSYGHDYGDSVLKTTADRIHDEVRETDTAARIGGDEFLLILSGITKQEIVERIAAKLVARISQDIIIDKHAVSIGASIGIAVYPEDGLSPEDLIRVADSAMYKVKQAGKNNFGFSH